jgi:hypothetical protein
VLLRLVLRVPLWVVVRLPLLALRVPSLRLLAARLVSLRAVSLCAELRAAPWLRLPWLRVDAARPAVACPELPWPASLLRELPRAVVLRVPVPRLLLRLALRPPRSPVPLTAALPRRPPPRPDFSPRTRSTSRLKNWPAGPALILSVAPATRSPKMLRAVSRVESATFLRYRLTVLAITRLLLGK